MSITGKHPGGCRMCPEKSALRRSHILPEFAYAPIYDKRHKGYTFDPLSPEKARKIQQGVWEKMLCQGCETFLNTRYESPFKSFWFDERPISVLDTLESTVIRVPDYDTFKLFHLSVLLRADLTGRPEFGEVSLGAKHRSRIHHMVSTGDPGGDDEYPIVCMAIECPGDRKVWWDLVASPNPGRLYNMRFYQFTFGGCGWMYFVGSHCAPAIRRLALRKDGSLPVGKKPWLAIKRFAPHYRRQPHRVVPR